MSISGEDIDHLVLSACEATALNRSVRSHSGRQTAGAVRILIISTAALEILM